MASVQTATKRSVTSSCSDDGPFKKLTKLGPDLTLGDDYPIYVYYWASYDEMQERPYQDRNGEFKTATDRNLVVVVYGVDAAGRSVCIRLTGVYRRFLIEFPDHIDIERRYRSAAVEGVKKHIFKFADRRYITVRTFQPLYDISKLKPMLEMSVSSNIAVAAINKKAKTGDLHASFPFLSKNDKIYLHEVDASAELQVMTTRQVPSVGWVVCRGKSVVVPEAARISRCDVEIICPVLSFGTPVVAITATPSLIIAAWDCEAFVRDVSNPGSHPDDAIFQFSIVTNTAIVKLLSLGQPIFKPGEVTGVEVLLYETERQLLLGFGEEMRKIAANIVTGWNINGFDWEILSKRASIHMCLDESLDFMKRIDVPTQIRSKSSYTSANGHKKLTYPKAEGVLVLDMLNVIKDSIKMSSYSLQAVGKAFLDEGKDDVDISEIFRCYRSIRDTPVGGQASYEDRRLLAKVGKYCVQDSALVMKIIENRQAVLSHLEYSAAVLTPPDIVHLNGQQMRFYSMTYNECRNRGIAVQADHGGEYSGQTYTGAYVHDPKPGLYKYVVSFDFASMYPSIIQCYNVDFSTVMSVTAKRDIPDSDFRFVEWDDHIGCEHDPIYLELVDLRAKLAECLKPKVDGSQDLYVEYDADEIRYMKSRVELLAGRLPANKKKFLCTPRKFKVYQKKAGVLPTIVEKLLRARRETRALMKTVNSEDRNLYDLLNQRQSAYKIAANSMYGAMGVNDGRLKCKHAAMCVCALGRESIHTAERYLKELGMEHIYGDTDSVYATFPRFDSLPDKERAAAVWKYSEEVAKKVTAKFQKPMSIEFEDKVLANFLILGKKNYIFNTVDRDGVVSHKLGMRGVPLVKRGYSNFFKLCYEKVIRSIFANSSLDDVRLVLSDLFLSLFQRRVSTTDTARSISVHPMIGGDEPKRGVTQKNTGIVDYDKYSLYGYTIKNPIPPPNLNQQERRSFLVEQLPAQMQLALRMIARGEPVPDGNRISYSVVERNSKQPAGCLTSRIEDTRYIAKHGDVVKVDYLTVIESTKNSLEKIASLVWKKDDALKPVYSQFVAKASVVTELKFLFAPRIVLRK